MEQIQCSECGSLAVIPWVAVISAVPAVMSSTETYPKKNEQSASRPFPGGFLFLHRLTISRQSPSETPVNRGGFFR